MESGRNSEYFEIPLEDDDALKSPRSPFTPRALSKPKSAPVSASDLAKKLETASERRSRALQETKEKNEQHVQKVTAAVKDTKESTEHRIAELKENLEMDLALKDRRRQQILEEKIGSAKKELDRVSEVQSRRSLSTSVKEQE
ncbi:hypothetical protein AAHC03_021144 [Spirometra sp. Aus1]